MTVPGPSGGDAEADGLELGDGPEVAAALVRTHEWFEVNSGWAPPDEGTLVDWGLEAIGRAPDECLVPERGVCRHGLVSWKVVLDDLEEHDARSWAEHRARQGPASDRKDRA